MSFLESLLHICISQVRYQLKLLWTWDNRIRFFPYLLMSCNSIFRRFINSRSYIIISLLLLIPLNLTAPYLLKLFFFLCFPLVYIGGIYLFHSDFLSPETAIYAKTFIFHVYRFSECLSKDRILNKREKKWIYPFSGSFGTSILTDYLSLWDPVSSSLMVFWNDLSSDPKSTSVWLELY